jgi:broad specificity phosphatase PhoE
VALVLAVVGIPAGTAAQASRVYLVRHAEKVDDSRDPELSAAGMARAIALAAVLDTVPIGAVLVSQFWRTAMTAAPTARGHRVTPVTVTARGSAADYADTLAARLLALPPGTVALVVGHSNTLTPTIAALGGPSLPDLCDSEYARLFILELEGTQPVLNESSYGALPTGEQAFCARTMAPAPSQDRSTDGADAAMPNTLTLKDLVGDWTGHNQLWVIPGEPVRESSTTARVELAAGGRYLVVRYTWTEKDEPQDGHLVVRLADDTTGADMVWVDSWHQGAGFLMLAGEEKSPTSIAARGSYPAPSGPDWGWRIAISTVASDRYVMRMWNITPDGQEALAVEASYRRR